MNLIGKLREFSEKTPELLIYRFIVNDKQVSELTFSELYQKSSAVASYLLQSGVEKNDRVLLSLPQSLDYLIAYFGCLLIKAIAIPLYPANKSSDFERIVSIVSDAEVKHIIIDKNSLAKLDEFSLVDPSLRQTLMLDIDDMIAENLSNFTFDIIDDQQIAFLQYTSGSTGAPKGVIVNHANLKANFDMMQTGMQIYENSKLVSWLPLYHDMGLIGKALLPVYAQAELTLMTPLRFVKRPFSWLEAISKYSGTHSHAPNFAYQMCVNETRFRAVPDIDLSSWRVALNGAEPVRASTVREFIDTFRHYGFNPRAYYPAYGMAEATLYISGGSVLSGPKFEALDKEKFKNEFKAIHLLESNNIIEFVVCGKPWLDEKILIVDPVTHQTKNNYEIGEIWLTGSHIAQGYWNKPEVNKETFNINTVEGCGPCFRTGDLGYLTAEGEIVLTGRLKDLIIIRGKNYAPQDLEKSVESCSDSIKPNFALAFSYDNENKEKLIIAVEIRDAISAQDIELLKIKIKEKLSMEHELLPDEIVFVARGAIPKTTSGKLQRQLCKKLYLNDELPLMQLEMALAE